MIAKKNTKEFLVILLGVKIFICERVKGLLHFLILNV